MDYTAIFEISASGMDFQRLRMETIANNLANANTTRTASGAVYKPLEAMAHTAPAVAPFSHLLESTGMPAEMMQGIDQVDLVEKNVTPRLVFNPSHPDADAQGYVAMPNINPVDEMLNMMTATRAYEANIRAMNAAKTMASRALEIGRK